MTIRPLVCVLGAVVLVGCGDDPPPAPKPQQMPSAPASQPRAKRGERPAIGGMPRPQTQPERTTLEIDRTREPLARVGDFAVDPAGEYAVDYSTKPLPDPSTQFRIVPPPEEYRPDEFAMAGVERPRVTKDAPNGFEVDSRGADAEGRPRAIVHRPTGIRLVLIGGGTYVRGSADDPTAQPPHAVSISPFYLSESEVTADQYAVYQRVESKAKEPLNEGDGDKPAVGLMWRDADGFAKWVGGRLPTEAEWELAARTTAGFANVWGNGKPLFRSPRQPDVLTDVMSEPDDRSRYGVFDLAGNAREWTADLFSERTYGDDAANAPVVDPIGESRRAGGRRVVRGQPGGYSVTHREGVSMSERDPSIGFRIAVDAPE